MELHDLYGPSALGRRFYCPASARMERHLPDLGSAYAEEGTLLHTAVHKKQLRSQLSDEQRQAVEHCARRIEEIRAGRKGKALFERKMTLSLPSGTRFGTADWIFVPEDA